MASWKESLGRFDERLGNRGPQQSTGTQVVDDAFNFSTMQMNELRDMGKSGFDQMDLLLVQLNEFGDSLKKGVKSF